MRQTFRIIFWLCLAALLVPSLVAIAIAGSAQLYGCVPDAATCGTLPWGDWLKTALNWAWGVALYLPLLCGLIAIGAIAAAIAFNTRRAALLAAMGLSAACIASLILPHVAVFMALPPGCHINEGGSAHCTLWGTEMGSSFDYAGAAFWMILLIAPIALSAPIITLIASLFRRYS
jgi:hypothetical protein